MFEIILSVLATIGAISALSACYYSGYLRGHKHGKKMGYDKASDDLLFVKDPEAWDKARYLKIEQKQAIEQATTKLLKAQHK